MDELPAPPVPHRGGRAGGARPADDLPADRQQADGPSGVPACWRNATVSAASPALAQWGRPWGRASSHNRQTSALPASWLTRHALSVHDMLWLHRQPGRCSQSVVG
eukprot:250526-Chlamydomonas_euryale.AAC.2